MDPRKRKIGLEMIKRGLYCRGVDLDGRYEHGHDPARGGRADIGEVTAAARRSGGQHRHRPLGGGREPRFLDRMQERHLLPVHRSAQIQIRRLEQSPRLFPPRR